MTKMLRITAKRAGFRRAGMAHPDTPVDHKLSDLSKEQIEALKAETMLIVQEIEGEAPKPGKQPKPTGDGSPPTADAPKGPARAEAIAAAVRGLEAENPAHFTKGGEPKVEAIEAAAGFQISGDERDAAWATVLAEREAAAKEA